MDKKVLVKSFSVKYPEAAHGNENYDGLNKKANKQTEKTPLLNQKQNKPSISKFYSLNINVTNINPNEKDQMETDRTSNDDEFMFGYPPVKRNLRQAMRKERRMTDRRVLSSTENTYPRRYESRKSNMKRASTVDVGSKRDATNDITPLLYNGSESMHINRHSYDGSEMTPEFNELYNKSKVTTKTKLLHEGEIQMLRMTHSNSLVAKIFNLKILRKWKTHKIFLNATEIYSPMRIDNVELKIPYNTIEEVSSINKWNPAEKHSLRVITAEYVYLFRAPNLYVRDQWIHSINWKRHKFKFEGILRVAERPEVLIKEIKNMIDVSVNIPLEDGEIHQFPLELISDILQQNNIVRSLHEEVIIAIGPLLEKNHPSPEICDFFSKHCRDSPRSKIVIEMFTPVVQRILKYNGDFGRHQRMRSFIQDYIIAILSQNGGLAKVQNFVVTMHSPASRCPFNRLLPNFVSVCLAAIHNCFEQRKKNENGITYLEPEVEEHLLCFTNMLLTMSSFEDWRFNLGPLLQSIPFPDEILKIPAFIKTFKNVIRIIAEDARCDVHQTLLAIREGKKGWLDVFCPTTAENEEEIEIFDFLLKRLLTCCCRKKKFLLSINKLLPQLILLALQENTTAIDTFCAMLDLDAIENRDSKVQIISALQNTQLGMKAYSKICEKQIMLKELQQKGGPRKLTLPSRSTDADLAKLLSSGCFGNLECLSLAFTNVTSACADYLIRLPSLKYLNLWSTQFGDVGLELISEHLTRLEVLNLCETPVTDRGLVCLTSLKHLKKLNLNSTNLSALTFEMIKESLPKLQECDIRYTDAWCNVLNV